MGPAFSRKYGVLTVTGTTAIKLPVIKRGVVDFAVGADWTPAAGDVKISKDGGAAANVVNLPTAVAMGNTAYWEFVLTAAELTCTSCVVTVADSATKVVEDTAFLVETFGHASALFQADLSAPNLPANVTQLLGTAWLAPAVAGTPDVNAAQISGDAAAADNLETMLDGTGGQTLKLGSLVVTAGVTITQSTVNGDGISISGNGFGSGINCEGGDTGRGVFISGGEDYGNGLEIVTVDGHAVEIYASGTGKSGIRAGCDIGACVLLMPNDGDGIEITTVAGHGINILANGTSKHGILTTGGTAGVSDGLKAVAGFGGVPIRGDITGNITGSVSSVVAGVTLAASAVQAIWDALTSALTTVGSVGKKLADWVVGSSQSGDSFARLGAPAGASVSADILQVKGFVDDIGVAGAGLTALGDARIANLDEAISSRMATYVQPTGFLAATFPSGTLANTTNITAGTIATTTNLTNLPAAPTDWLTAAAVSAGAVAEIQAGLSTYGGGDTAGTTTLLGRVTAAVALSGSAPSWYEAPADVSANVTAIKAKTDNLPASPAAAGDSMALTSAAVDSIWDEAMSGSTTARQSLRGFIAALLGKVSGLPTAPKFRDIADSKNVIDAATDANGNRTTVTLDLS